MLHWFGGLEANTVGWILIGGMQLFTLLYARKTEKNTNSMKDALVAVTAREQYAAGKEDQRVAGEAAVATLTAGIAQATEKKAEKP